MTDTPKRRAPGGGRKPNGPYRGVSANFCSRITPELRAELEALSASQGQSMSQVSEQLMRIGLEALYKGMVELEPAKGPTIKWR